MLVPMLTKISKPANENQTMLSFGILRTTKAFIVLVTKVIAGIVRCKLEIHLRQSSHLKMSPFDMRHR